MEVRGKMPTESAREGAPSNESDAEQRQVVVIGAGPAGLAAAYELTKSGTHPTVIEKTGKVGGIARTEEYRGYRFDMGGHRFFTKVREVNEVWREVLGEEFLRRPRVSRIYYNRKFFDYPLRPVNTLLGLGIIQAILIIISYLRWQLFPYRKEETYEQWVTNRFGRRLFNTFFKAYTEKVWGISCSELKAEWAAQRIKDLSLRSALVSMFFKPRRTITSLIGEFDYPRRGPGMMWEAVRDQVESRGGTVRLNADVARIGWQGRRVTSVVIATEGGEETVPGDDFVSSMPVTEFVQRLSPPAPTEVLEASRHLKYRDFLTVCLVVNKTDLFPDNWIYIHDPAVKVGRIQNFKNWSPDMVPDQSKSSLGLEYFCNEGDELWNTPDADLIELGKRELDRIGLARHEDVEDGCVFRVPKSYPVYDSGYREHLAVVREFVDGLENFQTIGRNGLHRYNNQDHAMLTGMLAVRNLLHGEQNDLWSVNADQEYHEAVEAIETAINRTFVKLDRLAFGSSVGVTTGVAILLATLALVLKGGEVVGPNLGLLGQFLPGYTVTVGGSLVGLVYGLLVGFVVGWSIAFLRNATMILSAMLIRRSLEQHTLRRVLEYL